MNPERVTILAVCTGNICRSPMVERLLAARLRERFGDAAAAVTVGSAGTWAHVGAPIEPEAARCLQDLGADPDGFRAREIDADLVGAADLILAAAREHRAAAVRLVPAAARRCFTVTEFARLLSPVTARDLPDGTLADRWRALIAHAAANRGRVRPEHPADDDIPDPYGAPRPAFVDAARRIDTALEVPLRLLAG